MSQPEPNECQCFQCQILRMALAQPVRIIVIQAPEEQHWRVGKNGFPIPVFVQEKEQP